MKIFRDDFGVPHIFAETAGALFEAYGYVVAQDRLWQLELFRRAAKGRLAAILGSDFLDADIFVRTTGYTEAELAAQFDKLPPAEIARFEAYRDGINRFIAEAKSDPFKLPLEFSFLGLLPPVHPEPWTVTDSMAFAVFTIRRFGEIGGRELRNQLLLDSLITAHGPAAGSAIFNDVRWINDPDAPVTVPTRGATETPIRRRPSPPPFNPVQLQGVGIPLQVSPEDAKAAWRRLGIPSRLGSYGWVIAPPKSTTHGAMLYGGPQVGFDTPSLMHEVQLTGGEGDFNVAGMAFAGIPGVLIGRTEHLAWTETTGAGDNLDIYIEVLCDAGTGYVFDGFCTPFKARSEVIDVAGAPSQTITVLRSLHGPVIASDAVMGLAATQKRVHWMREWESARGFLKFGQARNLSEFQEAIDLIATSHNLLYADDAGNIAYWQAGEVPLRPEGFDFRLPLPGTGEAEWPGGVLPTPRSINPAQRWLANWNTKPSVDFNNADEDILGKQFRHLEIQERLAPGGKVSPEDMEDIPKDIARVKELGREARFLKPYLLEALTVVGSTHPAADAARAILEDWDGSAATDAITSTTLLPAEVIFSAWLEQMLANTFTDELGAEVDEASTNMLIHVLDDALGGGSGVPPSRDYFNGMDPNVVVAQTFDQVLTALAISFGNSDPSAWMPPRGEIDFDHSFLPISFGSIPLSNRATYAQIVDFGRTDVEDKNILPLGQSGFINFLGVPDANSADQLELFRIFDYKPFMLLEEPA